MYLFTLQRNPDIKLYGLPWTFPGWLGGKTLNPYSDPRHTADYIVRWVLGARDHYGLDIDYIGVSVQHAHKSLTLRIHSNQSRHMLGCLLCGDGENKNPNRTALNLNHVGI